MAEFQTDIVRLGGNNEQSLVIPVAARVGAARAILPASLSGALPRNTLAELLAVRDDSGGVVRDTAGRVVVDRFALTRLTTGIVERPGASFSDQEIHRIYTGQADSLFPSMIKSLNTEVVDRVLEEAPTLSVLVNQVVLDLNEGDAVKGQVMVEFLHSIATGMVLRIPGFNPVLITPLIEEAYSVVKDLQPVNDRALNDHAVDSAAQVDEEANFRVLGSLINTVAVSIEVPGAVEDQRRVVSEREQIALAREQLNMQKKELGDPSSYEQFIGESDEVLKIRGRQRAARTLEQLVSALGGTTADVKVIDRLSRELAKSAAEAQELRDHASAIGNQPLGRQAFRNATVDQMDQLNDRG